MRTNLRTNWERHSANLVIAGFAWLAYRVRVPLFTP